MSHKKRNYISVYVRNSKESPSCYYRVMQYLETLNDVNYKVNNGFFLWEYRINLNCRGKWYQNLFQVYAYVSLYIKRLISIVYDFYKKPYVIIVQRELIPHYIPFFLRYFWEKLLGSCTVIWDFDDNIFLKEISVCEKKILEKKSDTIVVINNYLRSLLDKKYQKKVILLSTTDKIVDPYKINQIIDNRKCTYETGITVIWVGTSVNLIYLHQILDCIEIIANILKSFKKSLTLTVVCNKKLEYVPKNFKIKNVKWTREEAKKEIIEAHIGIMPLLQSEFAEGKGGFKLVQYISAALPVVGSNVGFNSKIIRDENGFLINNGEKQKWIDALRMLGTERELWETYSRNSLKVYNEKFSFDRNAVVWRRLIKDK